MNHDSTTVEPAGTDTGADSGTESSAATAASAPAADAADAAAPATPSQPTTERPSFDGYASARTERDNFGGSRHGFFAWIRSLRLQRQPGWIGGVSAGIAARIGIDPIIVRGVLVVLAIFAAPVLVFYAIAWLLLPDTEGRIHAQRLIQGDPQPALAGIVVLLLIGLTSPVTSVLQSVTFGNFWSGGLPFFWNWSVPSLATAFFNLVVFSAVTVFVVWLVRRSNKNSRSGGAASASQTASASAATFASGTNGGGIESGDTDAAASYTVARADATSTSISEPSLEPVSPGSAASVDELAAWKLQHEVWRTERERFNKEQADADRAARAQWAAENKARSQSFAAQAIAHRKLRKRENPRISASAMFFTLGVALVAGAGSAIAAFSRPDTSPYAATIGVLTAAFVASVAMIISGALRRRSGFLALVTATLLLIGLGTAAIPRDGIFLFPGQGLPAGSAGPFIDPLGDVSVYVDRTDSAMPGKNGYLSIDKASGNMFITVAAGTSVKVNATLANGQEIYVVRVLPNEDGANEGETVQEIPTDTIVGPETSQVTARLGEFMNGTPDLTIDAVLDNGFIQIVQYGN